MSTLRLQRIEPQIPFAPKLRQPFGRFLVDEGLITQQDLLHALELQCLIDSPLGEILISEGHLTRAQMIAALADQHAVQLVDLDADPPAPDMATALTAQTCLTYGVVPWMQVAGSLLVATSDPKGFDTFRDTQGEAGLHMLPVVADSSRIRAHQGRLHGNELAKRAATRVPDHESCRSFHSKGRAGLNWATSVLALLGIALLLAPLWTLTIAMLWALCTLVLATGLKLAAFCAQLAAPPPEDTPPGQLDFRLPRVSVLVPLLKEKEIAGALIKRLSRLTYPKSQLEVVLVLEAGDTLTRDTIARTALPDWISVIEVPEVGQLTTKPRALNYALDFCRGSIIGVWDAEDAPEHDQIERVVSCFHGAPDNVACVQGMLDYYNTRTNWISRCFTIEYATWWRILLPGIARLGFVTPLGGTTLFFRRDVLEKLCGWDAHNVTEDADLGVRLARHGYVTRLLPTVTHEEANCRAWPWVRQRSRWLKGFLITWCVHMRSPRKLWQDLGFKRFMGVQIMLLATVSQFVCAPLLWSFWLKLFGVAHPVSLTLGPTFLWVMLCIFVVSALINITISMAAVSGKSHRHLIPWVLSMPLYFPLGALAAYKGLYECLTRPFYWDKTQHGVTDQSQV